MNFFDTLPFFLLASILVPPVAGAALFFGSKWSPFVRRAVGLIGFGTPFVIAILLYCVYEPVASGGYRFESRLPTGLESFGIYLHLGLNSISMPLFMLAGTVGFTAGLYAMHSKAERPHLYLALLLCMQGGLMGTFASANVFFFYFFHEFALIPTFLMIGIWGGAARRVVAIEMAVYLTLGAILSLIGLIALCMHIEPSAESFSFIGLRESIAVNPLENEGEIQYFALLLFGFGILVSLFPFHSWAPKGYAVAPTGAAMLHAGVLKKFGLYGMIQIAGPLLPAGFSHWFPWIVWLALGNILVIGLITVAQRDLKMMLGYGSVMHMGYAFLGIATFSVVGVGGTLLLMVAHGLSISLLFMLSTCVYHRTHTFDMLDMGGLASKTPVLCGFFVAAIMAGIGLPGFGNFWGEFTIFAALAQTETTRWIVVPAAFGIVLSAIYGLRAIARVFFGPPSVALADRFATAEVRDLRIDEKIPAAILVAGLVAIGLFPRMFSDNADRELTALYPAPEILPVIDTTARSDNEKEDSTK